MAFLRTKAWTRVPGGHHLLLLLIHRTNALAIFFEGYSQGFIAAFNVSPHLY